MTTIHLGGGGLSVAPRSSIKADESAHKGYSWFLQAHADAVIVSRGSFETKSAPFIGQSDACAGEASYKVGLSPPERVVF
jgi:hypothetical protein